MKALPYGGEVEGQRGSRGEQGDGGKNERETQPGHPFGSTLSDQYDQNAYPLKRTEYQAELDDSSRPRAPHKEQCQRGDTERREREISRAKEMRGQDQIAQDDG